MFAWPNKQRARAGATQVSLRQFTCVIDLGSVMDYSQVYYKMSRPDLAQKIRAGRNRVLEVGCAEGRLGASLKQAGLAAEVVGIEIVADVARIATARLDRVVCGDIETMDREVPGLEKNSFDYVLCGDVLEHLRDPWESLRWLVSLLKRDGRLVASVPNVRHWSVILPLVFKGQWEYRTHGILDRTHLRFFTRDTAIELMYGSGLDHVSCEGAKPQGKRDRLAALCMTSVFASRQWLLVGAPRNSEPDDGNG